MPAKLHKCCLCETWFKSNRDILMHLWSWHRIIAYSGNVKPGGVRIEKE